MLLVVLLCAGIAANSILQAQDAHADKTLSLGGASAGSLFGPPGPQARHHCINVQDFGADPTNANDSSQAFDRAFSSAKESGYPLCVQAGIYRLSRAIAWDMRSAARTGLSIIGDGARRVILDFTQDDVPAPNFKIFNSAPEGTFFLRMGGFAIQSNVAGAALQIGEAAFTDPINSSVFGPLVVTNINPDPRAIGVQINYVVNSTFVQMVANLGGPGIGLDAIQLNQSVSNTFINAAGGNCKTSLHLTNGSNYGNTFIGFDFEEATTGIAIDNANSFSNTWIGGTAASLRHFVHATAGSNNYFFNMTFGLITNSVFEKDYGKGITLGRPSGPVPETPAIPRSGAGVANLSAQRILVYLRGGRVSSVTINGTPVFDTSNVSVILNPDDEVRLTYTTAPEWSWFVLH